MDEQLLRSAERVREAIVARAITPNEFRSALLDVPFIERDAWVDVVFGLDELLPDGPELTRGCVPYLPSAVEALLFLADHVPMRANDVFVDIGSGVGRAAALTFLLTGVHCIGIEVQSAHVEAARAMADRMGLSNLSFVAGDVLELADQVAHGTVFFLYCPFGGERLSKFLVMVEKLAQNRPIWVCTLDLPLPECGWLELVAPTRLDVRMYRSLRS